MPVKTNIDTSPYKVPPHHMEAEQSILGGILLDGQALNTVLDVLTSSDFYSEGHRKIFDALVDLSERGEPCDIVTLSNNLKNRQTLESMGGMAYLSLLVENVTSAANIAYHARIVKEKAILRHLITTATEILQKTYNAGADIDSVLDEAEHAIFEIAEKKTRLPFHKIKAIIKDNFHELDRLSQRKDLITGVPTGFDKLDDITSGLQRSDLIIIAGRPSMGKTAFALNIAQNAALKSGISVAIFSLEMAKEQLVFRMLSSEARVDAQRLRKGLLGETDWKKLVKAADDLSEASIHIDDSPIITVLDMKARARRLKADSGLGLIILDYLQLMRSSVHKDSREREISEISRSLKALAKELNVPVVALSQLNRKAEDRTNRRPQMADLRESGAIEQDADVIALIYRDEVYNKADDNPEKGIAEIIIGKQRNGPTGTVKLAFLEKYTSFENLARGDMRSTE